MDNVIKQLVSLFPEDDVMLVEEDNYIQLRGERMILQVLPSPEVSFHIGMSPHMSAQIALDIMKITEKNVKISKSFWLDGDNYYIGADASKRLFKYILGKVKMNQLYEYLIHNGNEGIEN